MRIAILLLLLALITLSACETMSNCDDKCRAARRKQNFDFARGHL